MLTVSFNLPTIHQVLYSDSFRKQVQGRAAFVLDTPEMRRVRDTQRIISGVRFTPIIVYFCSKSSAQRGLFSAAD